MNNFQNSSVEKYVPGQAQGAMSAGHVENADTGLAVASFPYISMGFLGLEYAHPTLNSQFFREFWQAYPQGPENGVLLHFPLRVPRRGFFDELQDNESLEIGRQLQQREREVAALAAALNVEVAHTCPILTLNTMGLALRYGIFDFPGLAAFGQPRAGNAYDYRICMQLYIGHLSTALSSSAPAPYEEIRQLSLWAMQDSTLDLEVRAHLFNTYLVASARYQDKMAALGDTVLNQTSEILYQYLQNTQPEGFRSCMAFSTLWRGMPMWEKLSIAEKDDCLLRSIACSEMAQPANTVERIVKDENDVTLNLTLAKWFGRQDAQRKIHYLQRLIELDPWDSTAYSELGLHFFKQSAWEVAHQWFQKAVDLGPPALGMNMYFKAEAELKLGRLQEAEASFRLAANIDPEGVSPHLSLIAMLQEQQRLQDAREAARKVLNEPDLCEQLSEEEIQQLQAI